MIADTLSRALLDNADNDDIILDGIASISLAIIQERRERLRIHTENYYVCKLLNVYIYIYN